ncbi:MAG: hydroxymethylbilane synthase [Hyphomicrobiales bacterium]|nr:hydroxymethylbilane synthase [Hyphomicrobiales bacterium]
MTVGTRGSPLALAQAAETRAALSTALLLPPEDVAVRPIRTTGDRITDRPLIEAGGKGLFTKEIDEALLAGTIDLAVHSAKDLPTWLPDGIVIAACLPREDVRDAFLSPVAQNLGELKRGAALGTSSPRRRAMALNLRPDLRVVDLRGNVGTRMRKLAGGEADATLLAMAGLRRLGLVEQVRSAIAAMDWLPAVGQGTIAITARGNDVATRARLAEIDHRPTSVALSAERACLAVLDGSCRTPIGGWARLDGKTLAFDAIIVKPDGSHAHRTALEGSAADAEHIGATAGAELVDRGGSDFFAVS